MVVMMMMMMMMMTTTTTMMMTLLMNTKIVTMMTTTLMITMTKMTIKRVKHVHMGIKVTALIGPSRLPNFDLLYTH